MQPRLVSLDIEAFRGFSQRVHLDLDADSVIVRGDNGFGKSSMIDAFLWLLTGELPHLDERSKGLRRTEDYVANRYSDEPYVALQVYLWRWLALRTERNEFSEHVDRFPGGCRSCPRRGNGDGRRIRAEWREAITLGCSQDVGIFDKMPLGRH